MCGYFWPKTSCAALRYAFGYDHDMGTTWARHGHDMGTTWARHATFPKGAKRSEAKRIFLDPKGWERSGHVHPQGAPHPKGGVHEPRSEAESAVRKEKFTHTHTCTVRIARTNRAVHPKGATRRVKIHAHAPAGCRCTHTQRKTNRTLRPSGARDRVKIAHTCTRTHAHTRAHMHAHTRAHTRTPANTRI